MAWLYGYRFKWKYVRKLAQKYNFYDDDIALTDERVLAFIRKVLKDTTHFRMGVNHKVKCILYFHMSEERGDLSGLRVHPERMRQVGQLLIGEDRAPRWYTDDRWYQPSGNDPESSDDDPLPVGRDRSRLFAKSPFERIVVEEE